MSLDCIGLDSEDDGMSDWALKRYLLDCGDDINFKGTTAASLYLLMQYDYDLCLQDKGYCRESTFLILII